MNEKSKQKEEAPKKEQEEKAEEKKGEKEVEVPEKFKKLVDEIEKMKVADLAELVKVLEEKFGVSAAPQMAVGAAVPAGGSADGVPAEEKSSFNIELKGVGDKKIEVIKAIRDVTQKGLKESKDLVDAAASGKPQMVKENAKKEEADDHQSCDGLSLGVALFHGVPPSVVVVGVLVGVAVEVGVRVLVGEVVGVSVLVGVQV